MREVPAYVCEKCLYYELGRINASKVEAHERIPVTGRCDSLDGLIVGSRTSRTEPYYLVFRQKQFLSQSHEALYIWERYSRQSLKPIESDLPNKAKDAMNKLLAVLPPASFTASTIVETVLYSPGPEYDGRYKHHKELSAGEFQRVAKTLKQKYPAMYSNTEFKRKLKYSRQYHRQLAHRRQKHLKTR